MNYRKISDQYYRYMQDEVQTFVLTPDAKKVELKPNFVKDDFFFICKDKDKTWTITHAATGLLVAFGITRAAAIENANGTLTRYEAKYESAIKDSILNRGLSPQFKLTETKTSLTDAELLNFAMLEMARQLTRKKSSN